MCIQIIKTLENLSKLLLEMKLETEHRSVQKYLLSVDDVIERMRINDDQRLQALNRALRSEALKEQELRMMLQSNKLKANKLKSVMEKQVDDGGGSRGHDHDDDDGNDAYVDDRIPQIVISDATFSQDDDDDDDNDDDDQMITIMHQQEAFQLMHGRWSFFDSTTSKTGMDIHDVDHNSAATASSSPHKERYSYDHDIELDFELGDVYATASSNHHHHSNNAVGGRANNIRVVGQRSNQGDGDAYSSNRAAKRDDDDNRDTDELPSGNSCSVM